MASSSSSSSQSCNWAVFLSFRGEDTRKTFVDHLYSALIDRQIPTYKDDETLPRGETIRPALFKAIKGSQIALIIFSKNYANSSWCLDELAYIMKCKDKRGLIVMPVFYDVTPSEVRKQEGEFGTGFAKQEVGKSNKVESWRKSLVDASDISGWEAKTTANGHESKVIEEIAHTVSDKLFSVTSGVDEDLVGMSARMQELEKHLDIGSHGVRMVGLWGVGGIGKTTLASSLYMKISRHFEGRCLLVNIREESSKHGLKTLQENLLSTLLKTKMELPSVLEGKYMIRSRLNRSSVLIILDDVDDREQLEALCGSHKWFGSGSRIIITTRDEHLLTTHKVDVICSASLLSHEEAIMLFNKHAYNKQNPINDYETLSSHVVSYAARLPLALKVLGSFLYDKDEKEWMSSMARLKDIPEKGIIRKLKISYDGLETVEKELFLDIACFFRRWSMNDAMEVFEACGYHPGIGIKVLKQKSLITIDNDRFNMHDLVQEMGHYIARREHPNDPCKHSRVWNWKDIENMCLSDAITENNEIEAIWGIYVPSDYLSPLCEHISNMKKLRCLHVRSSLEPEDPGFLSDYSRCSLPDGLQNAEGPSFLSNELCYIDWEKYPTSPFPDTFKALKLVILRLDSSLQKELWKGYKHLPCLKVLELRNMRNLLSTPDFDGLPSLQKLKLYNCKSLEKIHQSLGKHTSLEDVSVMECMELRMFPTIIHMRKLKSLEISECHESLEFLAIKSNMESLEKLSLRNIRIDALISKWNCSYLRNLDLSGCGLEDGEILSCIGEMSNLVELDLSSNDFTRLDFTLSQLTRLKYLNISLTCLVELPNLPSSLLVLDASYCSSLTINEDSFRNCKLLCDVALNEVKIINDWDKLVDTMLQGKANHCMRLQVGVNGKKFLPSFVKRGCRCILKLEENWCNDFSGFLICAVMNSFDKIISVSMKKMMSGILKSEDDVVLEESDGNEWNLVSVWIYNEWNTCFRYIPFASLKDTTWWNSIDKLACAISFHAEDSFGNSSPSHFGVRMVGRKTISDPIETSKTQEEYDHFSQYAPKVRILDDSFSEIRMTVYNKFVG